MYFDHVDVKVDANMMGDPSHKVRIASKKNIISTRAVAKANKARKLDRLGRLHKNG